MCGGVQCYDPEHECSTIQLVEHSGGRRIHFTPLRPGKIHARLRVTARAVISYDEYTSSSLSALPSFDYRRPPLAGGDGDGGTAEEELVVDDHEGDIPP